MCPQRITLEPATDEADLARVVDVLGGPRLFGVVAAEPLDLHDRLVRGLPGRALKRFAARCPHIAQDPALPKILGVAPVPHNARGPRLRWSWRRRRRFSVGSSRPALGLGQRSPLDLLETPLGSALVADHLVQLAFGVYV